MAQITFVIGGLTWDGQFNSSTARARTDLLDKVKSVTFDNTIYEINITTYNEDGSLNTESGGVGEFIRTSPYTPNFTAPKCVIQQRLQTNYTITDEVLADINTKTNVVFDEEQPPIEPEKEVSSAQSGNWSDPQTWIGGLVPDETSIVTIESAHTVVIDADVINTDGLHNKGKLTISDGISLTIGKVDPKTYGAYNIYANSVTESTGSGRIVFVGGAMQTVDTTAESRAKFTCPVINGVSGASNPKIYTKFHYIDFYGNEQQTTGMYLAFYWNATGTASGTFTHGISEIDILYSTFTKMKGLRDADDNKVSPYCGIKYGEAGWTGTGTFKVSIKNCDFRDVDTMYINGICNSSVASWNFSNNTLESTLNDLSTKAFALNNGSSSNVPINTINNVYKDVYVSTVGNYGWGSVTNSMVLLHCESNLDFRTGLTGGNNSSFGNTNINSTLKNGLSFFSETTENPHTVNSYNVERYISEAYPSSMIETNHFMAGCRNIINSLAIGDGDFFSFVGSWGATDNNEFNIVNNTIVNNREASIDSFSSILLAENITSYKDPVVNVKNNLAYKKNGSTMSSFARTNMTASEPLVVTLTNNANGNSEMPWTNSSYSTLGDQTTNIYAEPNFVDSDRGLRQATVNLLGYSGDVTENSLVEPYLLSNGYTTVDGIPSQNTDLATGCAERISDVVDWIFEGFTPTNMNLATAGENGTFVGAVMPKEISVESADLTLSANKTTIELGETVTFTLTLSQALSTNTTVVLTVDGADRNLVIPSGSTTDTTTHKPSVKGTKLISIKSTDNPNVTVSPSSVSVIVEEVPVVSGGGYYWCGNGKSAVKVENIVFVK